MDWLALVGAVVGVVGLLFTFYSYNKSRKPKRLQYETRIDQDIVSQSRYTRWDNLSVRFGDRDLKRPRVVVIRVTNTGKVEVRGQDFDEPLALNATDGSEIITATIAVYRGDQSQEVEPAKLSSAEVVAPNVVLNESEWLEFRLLVEGYEKPVRLRGHAAGFALTSNAPRGLFSTSGELRWMVGKFVLPLMIMGAALAFSLVVLNSDKVQVPNVVGKPVEQAVVQINDSGLKLGTVNRVRGSAKAGTVVSQSPAAGTAMAEDSTITLVVSDEP
jgi:PASTA domain